MYEDTQRGRCSCCGAELGDDITFDRTDSSLPYIIGNVTLMHLACNCGKQAYPLYELYSMVVNSYRNRHPEVVGV
jgi:hypothetical protein